MQALQRTSRVYCRESLAVNWKHSDDRIESQMRSGAGKVVEYWEAVLKRLRIYKAKAYLKEIHASLRRDHLEALEQPFESE